ncbi:MAG: ASCH domain-containing protein [Flavobacterium sp.]|nr:MAG: ASCH domain-containing protein [Flavobacterium sp.]
MKQEQTKILLSIKPEYAELIFTGKKKFEFRRTIFKNRNVKTVVVYASSPIQKVIGEFQIDSILQSDLDNLWKTTKKYAGIEKDLFFEYFSNKEDGFAIKIARTRKYRKPLCLKEDFNLLPPQSFLYLYR